jgi:hypothetical protein
MELEISGTKEEISSAIGSIKEVMGELSGLLEDREGLSKSDGPATIPALSISSPGLGEIPVIGKTGSGSEAILKLLLSGWGAKPRNIGEIKSALEANATPYPVTTISGILVHLVKTGKVKRWKTSAGYVYRENVGTKQ